MVDLYLHEAARPGARLAIREETLRERGMMPLVAIELDEDAAGRGAETRGET